MGSGAGFCAAFGAFFGIGAALLAWGLPALASKLSETGLSGLRDMLLSSDGMLLRTEPRAVAGLVGLLMALPAALAWCAPVPSLAVSALFLGAASVCCLVAAHRLVPPGRLGAAVALLSAPGAVLLLLALMRLVMLSAGAGA